MTCNYFIIINLNMSNTLGEIKQAANEGNKCCFVFPIEVGVYILGILQLIWACVALANGCDQLYYFSKYGNGSTFLYGLILVFLTLPVILGAWFYLRFFIWKTTRPGYKKQLPSAHFLNFITIVSICLWSMIGGLIFFGVPLMGFNFSN